MAADTGKHAATAALLLACGASLAASQGMLVGGKYEPAPGEGVICHMGIYNMLAEYGQAINVNPRDTIANFNISAAIRSLQMIEERISGGISAGLKNYLETSMQNILGGRLFND